MTRRSTGQFACPNCGALVPRGALACPECGSDEQTGWSDDSTLDGLDLPSPGYGRERRPAQPARTKAGFWKLVTIVVLVLLGVMILLGRW